MTNYSETDAALPVWTSYTLPPLVARNRPRTMLKATAERALPYTTVARAVAGSRWWPQATPKRTKRR